jgi:hypothetical protein
MPVRSAHVPTVILEQINSELERRILGGNSLRALAGAQAAKFSAAAPHPVYTVGLDALSTTDALDLATQVAWRYLLLSGGQTLLAAECDVHGDGAGPTFSHFQEGPLVGGTATTLSGFEHTGEAASGNYEFRALRVPSVFVFALWFKDLNGMEDRFIPVAPTNPVFVAGKQYTREEFAKLLRTAAERSPRGAALPPN